MDAEALEDKTALVDNETEASFALTENSLKCSEESEEGSEEQILISLSEPTEEHERIPVAWWSTTMTGLFPRQRLCQFLPVLVRETEDPRLPANSAAFPKRVAHRKDERGEKIVVEHEKGQLLKNGSVRKTVWYNCCPKGAQASSEAHAAGHRRAE